MNFAWWPHTTNSTVASYRLRCKRIVEHLQSQGIDAGIYHAGIKPKILILSKRYDYKSLQTARMLRTHYGTQLVLDLCDNHFYSDSIADIWKVRAKELRDAIATVDLVIASTEQLANVIFSETACTNIVVIGDAAEQPYQPNTLLRVWNGFAQFRLLSLMAKMAKDNIPTGHRLVWYGHHGSENAAGGISDLSRVKNVLEYCHQNNPISLTVISNNRAKYLQTINAWSIPTYYLDWNLATFSKALQLHDVAIIPVTQNPFTLSKTNNRLATALLHGLGIVADAIPSYQAFADCIELDNWAEGLSQLIEDKKYKEISIATGIQKINREWSIDCIANLWLAALTKEEK